MLWENHSITCLLKIIPSRLLRIYLKGCYTARWLAGLHKIWQVKNFYRGAAVNKSENSESVYHIIAFIMSMRLEKPMCLGEYANRKSWCREKEIGVAMKTITSSPAVWFGSNCKNMHIPTDICSNCLSNKYDLPGTETREQAQRASNLMKTYLVAYNAMYRTDHVTNTTRRVVGKRTIHSYVSSMLMETSEKCFSISLLNQTCQTLWNYLWKSIYHTDFSGDSRIKSSGRRYGPMYKRTLDKRILI